MLRSSDSRNTIHVSRNGSVKSSCRGACAEKVPAALVVRSALRLDAATYDERAAEWHADERVRLERLGKTPPFDAQLGSKVGYRGGEKCN